MKTRNRRRNAILFASLAILVVVGVFATFSLTPKPQVTPAKNMTKQVLKASTLGKTLSTILPKSKTIQTIVSPANDTWWAFIEKMNPQWDMKDLWADLPSKPTNLAYTTVYSSKDYDSYNLFAIPTTYLQYSSLSAATSATTTLQSKFVNSGSYRFLQLGKVVAVVPTGVFTDKVYLNTLSFPKINASDDKITQGYWYYSYANMASYVNAVATAKDALIYKNTLVRLGFSAKTTGSEWYGVSTDTLHWKGQNSYSGTVPVWSKDDVSATDVYNLLQAQAVKVKVDPVKGDQNNPVPTPSPSSSSSTEQYSVLPNQSRVLDYLAISTNKIASGYITNPTTGTEKKATTISSANVTRITLNPNIWLDAMVYGASTQYITLVKFSYVQLNLSHKSNEMDMTLIP